MNNKDMSELFSKFSNMVNEGNIPDEMKNILSSLSSGNNGNQSGANESSNRDNNTQNGANSTNQNKREDNSNTRQDMPNIDIETIMKMKTIMDKMQSNKNDPRANLLLSLKPYLKESRKEKVDQYIQLFGMSKVMEMFNGMGGEAKK